MSQIFVFGDSITYGCCDFQGGWVQRLKNYLNNKYKFAYEEPNIYNFGISGNTTEDVLLRFTSDIKPRLNKPNVIVFAIGINDSSIELKTNTNSVETNKFQNNIQQLINLSKKYSNQIIFVGLNPVEESKASDNENSYENIFIQNYNNIIKETVLKNKVYFIDVFDKWIKSEYFIWLEDGLHPNSEGHQKIFETVRDYLEENKII